MKTIIFGGTTEGREQAALALARGEDVRVSVTSEYARQFLPQGAACHVGALDEAAMTAWLMQERPERIIDATHPFAVRATQTIRACADALHIPYVRIERAADRREDWRDAVTWAGNSEEAAALAALCAGNILLTTGSHTLSVYAEVIEPERLFVRVLPTHQALDLCAAAGMVQSHVIAMQGPFSRDFNAALYDQLRIRTMVSKDSGQPGGVADKVLAAEGYDVFRAYTSSIVRKVLKSRGEIVPSLEEALEKLANESYDTVFVQPTHLLCGNEYDEKIRVSYMRYAGRFLRGGIGKPLIANNDDLLKLAEILAALKPDDADALLLMGHGTTHFANMVYPAMQMALRLQGHPNVVVGTVEGWPTLENAIDELRALGAKHIELRPMMLVAGDHAQNDMAGDDADSWKNRLTAAGFDVHCTVEGLGELEAVQKLYVEHLKAELK